MNFFRKKAPVTPEMTANNEAFAKFRGNVPLQRATVGITRPKTWKFYEAGDESKAPLVMFPPLGGTAEVFFKLFNELTPRGIRLISVQVPPINDHDEFIDSFSGFLDHLKVKRVHLLGCGLGGFLALLFTRVHQKRVISTILINSFTNNIPLQESVSKYEFAPALILRSSITQNYQKTPASALANLAAVDFYTKQMETLSQEELFSGMLLTATEAYIDKRKVDSKTLTILETDDFSSLNPRVRGSCASFFPSATLVPLKKGGDFPFISVADEVALYVNVHMRRLDPSLLPNIATDGEGSTFSFDKNGARFGRSVLSQPSAQTKEDEEDAKETGEAASSSSAPASSSNASSSSSSQSSGSDESESSDSDEDEKKTEPESEHEKEEPQHTSANEPKGFFDEDDDL